MSKLSRALCVIAAVASVAVAIAAPVQAQRFAVTGIAGTTGFGGGVVVGLASKVNVRATYGVVPFDPSLTIDEIDFGFSLPSFGLATIDLYPFGGFHLSGGLLLITDDGDFGAIGTYDGVSRDFAGTIYTGGPDDLLVGAVTLKSAQPYVGVGIGNPLGKRISVNFDAGVGFGSAPVLALTPQGPLADDAVIGPTYRTQVAAEVANIEAEIPDYFKYYPVFSISLSIGF